MELRIPEDFPVTCWHLRLTTGQPGWQHCNHSVKFGCDLRVVGMSTYRIHG